jgi:hypothetical protein
METLETVDLTPKWAAIMPVMLEMLKRHDLPTASRDAIHREIMRLAEFADTTNAEIRKRHEEATNA